MQFVSGFDFKFGFINFEHRFFKPLRTLRTNKKLELGIPVSGLRFPRV